MPTQFVELEAVVDTPLQMSLRKTALKIKGVEQRGLRARLSSHHHGTPVLYAIRILR